MISEATALKVVGPPAGLFVAAEAVPRIIQGGAEVLILTAAGIAALIYLVRGARRAVRGSRDLLTRVHSGLDILETTPTRFAHVENRLDANRAELQRHAAALDVLAEADRLRIKDVLAGEPRSPIDRRRSTT